MPLKVDDPTMASAMNAVPHPTNVYGPDGQLLGQFWPRVPGMSFPELGVTDEELDRIIADPATRWVTGDEVMARLRAIDAGGR